MDSWSIPSGGNTHYAVSCITKRNSDKLDKIFDIYDQNYLINHPEKNNENFIPYAGLIQLYGNAIKFVLDDYKESIDKLKQILVYLENKKVFKAKPTEIEIDKIVNERYQFLFEQEKLKEQKSKEKMISALKEKKKNVIPYHKKTSKEWEEIKTEIKKKILNEIEKEQNKYNKELDINDLNYIYNNLKIQVHLHADLSLKKYQYAFMYTYLNLVLDCLNFFHQETFAEMTNLNYQYILKKADIDERVVFIFLEFLQSKFIKMDKEKFENLTVSELSIILQKIFKMYSLKFDGRGRPSTTKKENYIVKEC